MHPCSSKPLLNPHQHSVTQLCRGLVIIQAKRYRIPTQEDWTWKALQYTKAME